MDEVKKEMLAAVGNKAAEGEEVSASFDVTMTFRVKMPLSRARVKREDTDSLLFELLARTSEGLGSGQGITEIESRTRIAASSDEAVPPCGVLALLEHVPA